MRKFSFPDVRWRRRLGIEPKTRKLTEEDKRKIVALYKEGYTQQEIAEMFGVDRSRISQILKEYEEGKIAPLTSSSSPSQATSPHGDDNILDATPYLKGGGTEREESEEDEDLEDLEKEVIDQEHVVEYSEEDFEEPEEVITTPVSVQV